MSGRIVDMPFAEYLAHPSYGSSDLKTFRHGPPSMVPHRRANREDSQTDATIIGTAAHLLVLTPTMWTQAYRIKPEGMTFASKEGKAWRDQHGGYEIITQSQWKQIETAAKSVIDIPAVSESLVNATGIEQSVFWECRESGLPCKGRPDWFDSAAVYDLKVSVLADRSLDDVRYGALRNGWLHQLPHNRSGLYAAGEFRVKRGRLVIASPTTPGRVYLLEISEQDMDLLELTNEQTRREMARCHRSGVWPGMPDQWQRMELPATAAFEQPDEMEVEL